MDTPIYQIFYIKNSVAASQAWKALSETERTAPLLARVNKDADMALLRQIMGKPDLQLTFQSE